MKKNEKEKITITGTNHVEVFSEESYLELYDENGKPCRFLEVAAVEYEGSFYELLMPEEELNNPDGSKVNIVLFTTDEKSGEKLLIGETNKKKCDEIFSLYMAAVSEFEVHDCSGCGKKNCKGSH